jgi:subtilisin family serine protease
MTNELLIREKRDVRRLNLDDAAPPPTVIVSRPPSGLSSAASAVPDDQIAAATRPAAPVAAGAPGSLASILRAQATAAPLRLVPDGTTFTDASWQTVKPKLASLPLRASDDARGVLLAYFDPKTTVSDATRADMRSFLMSRGYPMPAAGAPLSPQGAEAIRAQNLTEPDAELARLSQLTGRTDNTQTMAVIDGGFDIAHPAFDGKLWTNPSPDPAKNDVHGYNFRSKSATLFSDGWDPIGFNAFEKEHGTKQLGIATQGADRLKSMALVGADSPFPEPYVDAIEYAVAHGARVVSMSFSATNDGSHKVADAVVAAIQRHPDVLFVEAAGNDGHALGTAPLTPDGDAAAHVLPNYVVVGASDSTKKRYSDSNDGAPYTTVAADADFYTPRPDGKYDGGRGYTSEATPEAANVAGKCLLLDPGLSASDVRTLLIATADQDPSWQGLALSNGPVDPTRAMRLAALTGLVRSGMSADAAADRIGLSGDERANLLALAPQMIH